MSFATWPPATSFTAAAAGAIAAQPEPFPAPPAPPPAPPDATPTDLTILPAHDLFFPESANNIGSVMFPPGGARALVQLNPSIIDLWAGAVSYWPEILGALLALIAVACFWRALRVLRRPRQPGALHCRRCNYNLTGLPPARDDASGGRCPECGAQLARRRPIRGRRLRWRLAPAILVLGAAALGYTTLHILRFPRWGPAQEWLSIPSIRAYELSQQPRFKWIRGLANGEQIVEVDLATGAITRRMPLRRSLGWMPAALSPDGSHIAISGGFDRVDLISVRSGRRGWVASLRHDPQRYAIRGRNIAGFSEDGESIYLALAEGDPQRERLIRWDWRRGERETVLETDLPERTTRNFGRMRYVRSYQLAQRGEALVFVASPYWEDAEPGIPDQYLRIHDAQGRMLAEHQFPEVGTCMQRPITPDAARSFGYRYPDIRSLDLLTGEAASLLPAPSPETFRGSPAIDPSGRLLAAATAYWDDQAKANVHRAWLIYDLQSQRWLARLPHDPDYEAGHASFSPDGRWFAFIPHATDPGPPRRGVRRVVLYDLAPLREHLAGARLPGESAPPDPRDATAPPP